MDIRIYGVSDMVGVYSHPNDSIIKRKACTITVQLMAPDWCNKVVDMQLGELI